MSKKTTIVNSIKIELELENGRDIIISKTHTPSERVRIEHADLPDLERALYLMREKLGRSS